MHARHAHRGLFTIEQRLRPDALHLAQDRHEAGAGAGFVAHPKNDQPEQQGVDECDAAVQGLDKDAAMRKRRPIGKMDECEAKEEYDHGGSEDPPRLLAPTGEAQVVLPQACDFDRCLRGLYACASVGSKGSDIEMRTVQDRGPAAAGELPRLRHRQLEAFGNKICLPPDPDNGQDDESQRGCATYESQNETGPHTDALQPDEGLAGSLSEGGFYVSA